jgi:glucose/arabinose dehydrogenase
MKAFHRMTTVALAMGLALSTSAALAQTAAPAAPPAPAWKQGMSESMATSTLAPLAGKNTVTPAADIPIDKIKLPPGFKVEVWATGLPGGRAMAMGDEGKIYVGTRGLGRVYEVSNNGTERTVRTVVDKLVQPAGVAFKDGTLYVMAINKVLRYDGIEKNPTVAPVDMTEAFKLPTEQHHNSMCRLARRATSARCPRPSMPRSAATTPTARAWKWWPLACATAWASTGTPPPMNSGSATTAATGWARTPPTTLCTACTRWV